MSLIGRRRGWALIRGWAPINFFGLKDGRLFEVGANSRLGAYLNKYGISLVFIVNVNNRKKMRARSSLFFARIVSIFSN